jgi:hypothetical protein
MNSVKFCKTALCYFTEESKESSKVIRFVTSGVEIMVT